MIKTSEESKDREKKDNPYRNADTRKRVRQSTVHIYFHEYILFAASKSVRVIMISIPNGVRGSYQQW